MPVPYLNWWMIHEQLSVSSLRYSSLWTRLLCSSATIPILRCVWLSDQEIAPTWLNRPRMQINTTPGLWCLPARAARRLTTQIHAQPYKYRRWASELGTFCLVTREEVVPLCAQQVWPLDFLWPFLPRRTWRGPRDDPTVEKMFELRPHPAFVRLS